MNIYLVKRTDDWSYDDYDSFVCYASTPQQASTLNPSGDWGDDLSAWCSSPRHTQVTYLGQNNSVEESKIIHKSFNAG